MCVWGGGGGGGGWKRELKGSCIGCCSLCLPVSSEPILIRVTAYDLFCLSSKSSFPFSKSEIVIG